MSLELKVAFATTAILAKHNSPTCKGLEATLAVMTACHPVHSHMEANDLVQLQGVLLGLQMKANDTDESK